MNETELRQGLQEVVATASGPPAMSAGTALKAARRVRQQRRAIWSAVCSVIVIAAIALGTVMLTRASTTSLAPAGPAPTDVPENRHPPGKDSGPREPIPVDSGPRYDQSARLLARLEASVPVGYAGSAAIPSVERPIRSHTAGYVTRNSDLTYWVYDAELPVTRGGQAGLLGVMVIPPGSDYPKDPCLFAADFVSTDATCQVTAIAGGAIGVVTSEQTANVSYRYDQSAVYVYPDGTIVMVRQARALQDENSPPALATLPFTEQQLAALATDPRFQLS